MEAAGIPAVPSPIAVAQATPLDPFGGWRLASTGASAPDAPALRRLPEALLARTRLPRGCAGEHRGGAPGFLAVMHILSGKERGCDLSGTSEFAPGDLIVWNTSQSAHFEVLHDIEKLIVFLPMSRIVGERPELVRSKRALVQADNGFGPLLAGFFSAFARQAWSWSDVELDQAVAAGVDLTARAVRAMHSAEDCAQDEELIDGILRHVETRLAQPTLSSKGVARKFGISTRYLQVLFARRGATFTEWVRLRRLEKSREALLTIGRADRTVTDIALAWGFNDPGYFSRLFRKTYGHSPSEFARTRRPLI